MHTYSVVTDGFTLADFEADSLDADIEEDGEVVVEIGDVP